VKAPEKGNSDGKRKGRSKDGFLKERRKLPSGVDCWGGGRISVEPGGIYVGDRKISREEGSSKEGKREGFISEGKWEEKSERRENNHGG